MQNIFIKKIISGGQSGVDRAALDIAIELNIPHGGWCPFGRKAEDGIISNKYNLQETPKPPPNENKDPDLIYKKRTELNVIDSDGTLLIVKGSLRGGTLYTLEMAQNHDKPYFIFDLSEKSLIEDVVDWILINSIHLLNIAGPRESQSPGIYFSVYEMLKEILNHHKLTNK